MDRSSKATAREGAWAGAVLAGGASRRMGVDKAFVEIDGTPMVWRVIDALTVAGADSVIVVGGDGSRLASIGIAPIADHHPGEGPLQGVITAIDHLAEAEVVVVLACDLLAPDPVTITAVVAALHRSPDKGVAVPVVNRRRQWMHAAWRPSVTGGALMSAWQRGERSLRACLEPEAIVEVHGLDPDHLGDADNPADLPS